MGTALRPVSQSTGPGLHQIGHDGDGSIDLLSSILDFDKDNGLGGNGWGVSEAGASASRGLMQTLLGLVPKSQVPSRLRFSWPNTGYFEA
jgi:hypothetical protein